MGARPQTREMRHVLKREADIVRTAFGEAAVQAVQRLRRNRGQFGEPWIPPAVSRQERQQNVRLHADAGDLLDAVAPVLEPAKETRHDDSRLGDYFVDIDIHRQRMTQPADIGESQGGKVRAVLPARHGRGGEVGIREGQEHHVRRALAQIDGGIDFVEAMRFAEQKVHGSGRKRLRDGRAVETGLPDHHEAGLAPLIRGFQGRSK